VFENNQILSLNFSGEKTDAGLFFDFDQDKTVYHTKPEGFIGELKTYQSHALTWMLCREGVYGN
jgi:hypothetical protein